MNRLKYFFFVVDLGFIVYWLITLSGIIPNEHLFKDYENPILVAWNWSFLPLDLFISCTGFASLWFWKKDNDNWKSFALVSLALTFCSGLQALTFWTLRSDFEISWWVPNLFLLIYPLYFIPSFLKIKE